MAAGAASDRAGSARLKKLLIANRGEIAVRIARTAAEMGIATVGVYSEDDAASLHTRKTDEAHGLKGSGPAAYLGIAQMVETARAFGADAVHPGYGFLAENAAFARACGDAGLTFVGPTPETLELFGDKARARALAASSEVPVLPGTDGPTTLAQAADFLASLGEGGAVMVKAMAGGGGRGMRPAASADELAQAFDRCASEAAAAFGDASLYVEQFLPRARHVEVQIVGDGVRVSHLWDRECSLQRQRQKLVEIAPADALPESLRQSLFAAAVRLGEAAAYRSLGTIEFLVDADQPDRFVFIEANARLQVEHTVTEEVTGLDLVRLQLQVAAGRTLDDLALTQARVPEPRGHAVQVRVNLETMTPDGSAKPAAGVLSVYEAPSGPGVRVDGFGYAGYQTSARFDSLLAKLIVHAGAGGLSRAVAKAYRALSEFRIEGSPTNIAFLQNLLADPAVAAGDVHTRFIEDHMAALGGEPQAHPKLYFDAAAHAGPAAHRPEAAAPAGTVPLRAPLQGTVIALQAEPGSTLRKGQALLVMEAMKMEHVIAAETAGVLQALAVQPGDTVFEGDPLAFIAPAEDQGAVGEAAAAIDLDLIRPDLAEVIERHRILMDEARPEAVAKRRRTGQRTARENLDDLFDPGSFAEFGAMAVAAQRRRRSLDDLRINTPADGMVTGVGAVNGRWFDEDRARCVGLAYDFTVLAGTQGHFNHKKTDRILEFAEHWKAPVIWFTEGGGGRPGDVDGGAITASSLDTTSFTTFARLSGLAPRIAINSGRCFAGNAVFFGCADITIATRYSNIGLGGPAMIEGGGLGVFTPDEIGPSEVQYANGALDLLVEDEAAATAAAKQLLGVFQGAIPEWTCADQRTLRHLIPENRVRAYDVRPIIETLADEGTWIELRGGYGKGMITGFLRVEGRPMGVMANDPRHLGGAIDSEGAEKGGRFLQLCDAFDVPVLSLCDTPGFMVGPQSETTAAIRRGSRLFVTATSLTVPLFTVVLRKGYGLGAQAMAGGDLSASALCVAWPTAEFGPMGLEGAVRLGYRKELETETDPAARQALFEKLVGRMYENGKALSVASVVEIDAVIDPAETRAWLVKGLKACPVPPKRPGKKRPFVDVW